MHKGVHGLIQAVIEGVEGKAFAVELNGFKFSDVNPDFATFHGC
jgi:hypothetical protein